MDQEGVDAFRTLHGQAIERKSYMELARMISDAASDHGVLLRIDALYFLTLNFEHMVAMPIGQRSGGTIGAILDPSLRNAIAGDLKILMHHMRERFGPFEPEGVPPERRDLAGLSSGQALAAVSDQYSDMQISYGHFWGD